MSNIPRKASTASNNTPKKVVSEGKNVGKKRDVKEAKGKPRGGEGMYLKDKALPVKEGLSRTGETWSPAKEGWKKESGDPGISDKGKEEEKSVKRPEKVVGRKREMGDGEASRDIKGNESKKVEKELSKEEAKNPFNVADTSGEIASKLANEKDRANIKLVTQASGKLIPTDTRRLVLMGVDLADPASEKMGFAWKGDYGTIKVKLDTVKDAAIFIDFINNSDNEKLLSRIEVIEVGDIGLPNVAGYQKVLDVLGEKRDQFKNLSTWVFQRIFRANVAYGMSIIFPKGLSISDMKIEHMPPGEVAIRFPETLRSLSCGDVFPGTLTSLEELKELTTFSCEDVEVAFAISKKFSNLTTFSCNDIGADGAVIVPKELKKLQSFKCGDIFGVIEFPEELKTLKSLECQCVERGEWPIIFPENLDNLSVFRFGDCADLSLKKEFEQIQVDIAVRESKKKTENKES